MLGSGKRIDTLFNVCFELGDVDSAVERVRARSADMVTVEPWTLAAEAEGSVRVAAVRSCVGNVIHTLVDTRSEQLLEEKLGSLKFPK